MYKAIRDRLVRDEDGFTLIELLVVVIIIGILAAIAIPTFLNQRERGWQAELTSGVRNAALEVEAEITKNGGTVPVAATGNTIVDNFEDGVLNLTYALSGSGFEICGSHTEITSVAAHNVTYDSTAGGLQDFAEVAC